MVFKSALLASLVAFSTMAWQEPAAPAGSTQEPAAPAVNLEGIKCVVMGDKASASAEHAVAWRDGVIYVCCEDCKAAFEKDSSAFSMQANHQLVLTGQYEQKLCPISGHAADGETKVTVGGVELAVCCADCKSKLEGVTDATEQARMVFADEVFEKCFAKKSAAISLDGLKCFLMPKKDVSADKVVEYNGAKIFLCCDGCVKRFSKDPSKFAAQANHQLVRTGQFQQTGCPIGGGAVDPEQSLEVGGVKVSFCCENCKTQAAAVSGADQVNLVFGQEAFSKGFAKQQ